MCVQFVCACACVCVCVCVCVLTPAESNPISSIFTEMCLRSLDGVDEIGVEKRLVVVEGEPGNGVDPPGAGVERDAVVATSVLGGDVVAYTDGAGVLSDSDEVGDGVDPPGAGVERDAVVATSVLGGDVVAYTDGKLVVTAVSRAPEVDETTVEESSLHATPSETTNP